MPEERDDVDAGRHLDEPLLEPHEQVVDLRRLRHRLRLGDPAERERPLPSPVVENDAIAAVPLLERGHAAPFRPMPPQCGVETLTKFLPHHSSLSQADYRKPNENQRMREAGLEPARLAAQ